MSEIATAPAAPAPATQTPAAPAAADTKLSPSGFDALDAKVTPKAKEPAKAPDAKPDTAKGEDKPADAKGDKKEPGQISTGPKALREQLDKVSKERSTFETEAKELRAKFAEMEKKGGDTKAITERYAALEKEHQEAMATIRGLRSEMSPEFKEKYDKPFNTAAERAARFINQLQVVDAEGQPVRKADWKQDFSRIYQLDYSEAKAMAKQLFGEEAGQVMGEYQKLHDLDETRAAALTEEKANFEKRNKEEIANRSKQVEYFQSTFKTVTEDIASKNPHFQERPDDPEGNILLKEGYRLVDSAMLNGEALTPEQKIVMDAQIRHRAASFTRMKRDLMTANERIAELETALGEKKEVEPGGVQRGGGQAAKVEKSLSDELREVLA